MRKVIQKIALYFLLFTMVFIITGDAYISYLGEKVFQSDYAFELPNIDKVKDVDALASDLKEYCDDLDIIAYAVTVTVSSYGRACYTIYTYDGYKPYIQEKLLLDDGDRVVKAFLYGETEIRFCPMEKLSDLRGSVLFYTYASKDAMWELRGKMMNDYSTSLPYEKGGVTESLFMVFGAWSLLLLVCIVYAYIEISGCKKEVLLKNMNGTDRAEIIRNKILHNSTAIIGCFALSLRVSALFTESMRFLGIASVFGILILLGTNLMHVMLKNLNVKKLLSKNYRPAGYQVMSVAMLLLTSVVFVLTLEYNIKNIHDAALTINQEGEWEELYDYDTVNFTFREESESANFDKDAEYRAFFYNTYLEDYNIRVAFNYRENGANHTWNMEEFDDEFVYLNIHAAEQLEPYGIYADSLEKDRYYVVSRYTDEELKEKDLYTGIENLFPDTSKIETIQIEKGYTVLVMDINMENLADNYIREPIVVLDTHTTIFDVWNFSPKFMLIHTPDENDFRAFIDKIGYSGESWYCTNVKEIFTQKKNLKVSVLILNVILSLMLAALYIATLVTVLKMDFDSRSMEIALNKIYGKTFFRRYKKCIRFIWGSVLVGFLLTILLNIMVTKIHLVYSVIAGTVLAMLIFLNISIFIKRYESINIQRILKGGV